MNDLPQVYRKYDLLFTPHLIPHLRNLRSEEWAKFIDYLSALPEMHPDTLAFAVMMINLGGCLTCEMDSYRAQRGCAICARQTILSFKDNDQYLMKHYEAAKKSIAKHLPEFQLQQAA